MKYFSKRAIVAKAIAIVMAGAMTLGALPMSFAAQVANKTKLEILTEMNVIKGEGQGTEISPDDNLTRYRAFTMLLRLTGNEDEMEDFNYLGEDTFEDAADKSAWMQKLMAYLKNNDHGVDGYEDGKLLPLGEITTKEYAKTMLEVLGYVQGEDFEWKTIATKAASLGLMAEEDINNEIVDLETVAELTYNALATPAKGDTITLGEKLGKPVVETKLEVKEVSTDNLKQITVKFNKAVDADSAEDVENYTLSAGEVANASLSADGKTVVLTLKNAVEQQAELDLTIEDVKSTDDKVLDTVEFENVEFLDMAIPTVVDAIAVGNDTIKVIFSEPVQEATEGKLDKKGFEVNGGKLYIKEVRLQNNNTEALVELYSDLKDGETTITVNNSTVDYAGFGVVKETLTVDVEKDEEAPVVVGYEKATPNGVTLIWSEDIELKDGTATNFYHTNANNEVTDAIVVGDIDGNKMELDFTENNLPEGTAYVYVLKDSVNDLWDNDNAQQMIKVEVEVDTTAPEVEGTIEIKAEDQVVIEFTEALDKATAEDEDNYILLDAEGKEVEDMIDDITYADKKVTIDFSEKLSGEHTLVIKDVEDLVGNEIADTTLDFDVEDLTKPVSTDFSATLYNAGKEGQMVKVNFGEKMAIEGKYSILDLEKYEINGYSLADLDVEPTITLVDGGKAVEIEIASDETTDGIDLTATGNVVVARVADMAGNYTTALTNSVELSEQGNVFITDVKVTSTKTVEVTFADELVEFNADDIMIATSTDATTGIEVAEVETTLDEDGNTVVIFTVANEADEFAFDVESAGNEVYALIKEDAVSHNIYNEVITNDSEFANQQADDKVTPELVVEEDIDKVTAEAGKIRLTFTEAIDANTLSILTFEVEDLTVTGITVEGNDIVLTVKDGDNTSVVASAGTKVTQEYAAKDIAGNKIENISTKVAK